MKKKILILDDKETIAKVLSIYLMSDYDVQWLPDGLQGVKWLQAGNTPDLIISDIRMPGMRGDDFLEWIKQNELFRHIPVIMLSSEDSTSERIRLLEIGAEESHIIYDRCCLLRKQSKNTGKTKIHPRADGSYNQCL